MVSLSPVAPLLVAAGILLAGNGMQSTLLTVRAEMEGFAPFVVGAMGTTYFLGFLAGSMTVARLIANVGHIRVFAGLAAIVAATSLALVMFIDPYVWIGLRLIVGFCVSGLFTVVESWLNESTDNADRGQLLSIYRLIDLFCVTGSQLILPVVGADGFEIFALMAMLFCLSLVPVSMSRQSAPAPSQKMHFDLQMVWRISPLACIGMLAIGLSNNSFRTIGPLYASRIGLDLEGVAYFMAAGIIGGAVLQFPLGILSDRWDRRWVLIFATLGASLAGLSLSLAGTADPYAVYAGIFVFGAFALPLYSLSVAHANDHAPAGEYAAVSAGLIFLFSIGAAIGPILASLVIEQFGAPALFTYISLIHLALVAVALYRLMVRPSVPRYERVRYTALLRTSPAMFRLAKRRLTSRGGRNGRRSAASGPAKADAASAAPVSAEPPSSPS